MTKLARAADKAIRGSLRLKRSDRFLLVTDTGSLKVAEALAGAARAAGAETTTYLLTESLRPVAEPTGLLRLMARRATAIAYILESRFQEKTFRGFLVKTGRAYGRVLMMPGMTREMMERLVDVDLQDMKRFTSRLVRVLRNADEVTVENPRGTRISFSVRGRTWVSSMGDLGLPGSHGNLPAGECYTAPVEESFSGRVVLSLIDDKLGPGVLEFERGRLKRGSGRGVEAILAHIGDDETGRVIGEFGVGTNRGARICPNMLEAEKAFGTVHFAIGDSYGLGRNSSRHHYDALVEKATIRVAGRTIALNGRYMI
ncbi:MAG: hypothetical protein A2Y56_11565 [Candidatus Aminicenantes bacterium RBG_13_63_10]|nr:MAG: hypothetical protein A2Y56_11565 [Candidatus Aminicenantes bacterium RBG_13_63_10]